MKHFNLVLPKMQKLVKAAKEGTKDGLEKTKAAVKKGRSFIKTKSFCQGWEEIPFYEELFVPLLLHRLFFFKQKCSLFREEVILF